MAAEHVVAPARSRVDVRAVVTVSLTAALLLAAMAMIPAAASSIKRWNTVYNASFQQVASAGFAKTGVRYSVAFDFAQEVLWSDKITDDVGDNLYLFDIRSRGSSKSILVAVPDYLLSRSDIHAALYYNRPATIKGTWNGNIYGGALVVQSAKLIPQNAMPAIPSSAPAGLGNPKFSNKLI